MGPIALASTYASEGGAARASVRLLRALRGVGADASLLCQFPGPREPGVEGPGSRTAKAWAHVGRLCEDAFAASESAAALYSPARYSWGEVPRRLIQGEGLVHLHWVQKGFLSIEAIGRLQRPFLWTFHDMWPLSSGLHYDSEGKPRQGSRMQRSVWNRKLKAWSDSPVTVISPSHWLAELASHSPLFQGRPVHVIPNAIDTERFRPVDPSWARSLLGIPEDKKVILFGAMDATSDPRKGFDLLVRALDGWTAKDDVHLVIVGSSEAPGLEGLGYQWTALGQLNDDLSLVVAYNAADVVVVPSRQENLSNMLLEALACGVPCVGFRIGGNPDAIVPGRTGDLAEPENPSALRSALDRVLFASTSRDLWRPSTRQFAIERFSPAVVAKQHLEQYQLLEKTGLGPGPAKRNPS